MFIENTIEEMKLVFKDVPYGIDHSFRVLNNFESIMDREIISGLAREFILLFVVLHDISAIEIQKIHGSMEGHFQSIKEALIAQAILERAGAPYTIISRVFYIVENHHTPCKIGGIDF
jgi:hypothetical protein